MRELEILSERFEAIVRRPTAIKKIRGLILDIAIRGKLTSSTTMESEIDETFRRSQQSHEILNVEPTRAQELTIVGDDEKPYEVPTDWTWQRLGQVCDIIRGITFPASEKFRASAQNRIACLRTASIQDEVDWDDLIYIDTGFVKRKDQYVRKDDILISMANSYSLVGKVSLVREVPIEATIGGFIAIIRPLGMLAEFLYLALSSPTFQAMLRAGSSQTTNIANISLSKINPTYIAIPGFEEQRRIVAKVDQLMALCDELERQQAERERVRMQANTAAVHTLLQSDSPTVFTRNWHRIRDRFDLLYSDPANVQQLRQGILQLAVQGKLVPQDPEDEPAEELLKRIDAEREQFVEAKKIRRQKYLGPVAEIPFAIPDTWKWRYLADVCFVITDGAHHTPKYQESGVPFLSVKDVSSGIIYFTNTRMISEADHRELSKRCHPEKGDILLTKVGTTGIAVTIDDSREFSIFVSLALLKFSQKNIEGKYLKYLINSPHVRRQSAENTQGIGNKNLVLRLIQRFSVPIPPLAEQRRIVAKVDELMRMCDELESGLRASQEVAVALLEAVVAGVVQASA